MVDVIVSQQTASPTGVVGYLPPNIFQVSRIGNDLILNGTNFGVGTQASIQVGGLACDISFGYVYQTDARCRLPAAGSGSKNPVTITVAGQTSNIMLFDYQPKITSVSALSPIVTTGGAIIEITGTGFNDPKLRLPVSVLVVTPAQLRSRMRLCFVASHHLETELIVQ